MDEDKQHLKASETVTYYNNSPDTLDYLWLQLDENEHSSVNNAGFEFSSTIPQAVTADKLKISEYPVKDNGYGVRIEKVTDANGNPLKYTINKTMMRIDLATPLKKEKK